MDQKWLAVIRQPLPNVEIFRRVIVVLVLFLVGAVVWIAGTLPWVTINYVLCLPDPTIACENAADYGRQARQILAADLVLVLCSVFAIFQIRRLRRARQNRPEA